MVSAGTRGTHMGLRRSPQVSAGTNGTRHGAKGYQGGLRMYWRGSEGYTQRKECLKVSPQGYKGITCTRLIPNMVPSCQDGTLVNKKVPKWSSGD